MTDKTRSENWGQSIEGIECHIYVINVIVIMVIQSYLGYRQKTNALKQNSNQLKQKGINLTSKSGNSGMAGSRDLNDTISTSY